MTLPATIGDVSDAKEPGAVRVGYIRWIICALLFLATVINYIDRTVISVLEPELRRTIGWNDVQWGYIGASFMLAYAIGFPFAGWMMDKLGTRLGFTISLIVWSLAAASTAFARNLGDFMLALRSGSENRATIPPRSRRSPSGSPNANGLSPRELSTPAPMSAPRSLPSPFPSSTRTMAGRPRFSLPDWAG